MTALRAGFCAGALAIPVGLAWWLLSPGGLRAAGDQAPEVAVAQDGTLALLLVAAAALSTLLALAPSGRHPVAGVTGVMAGSLLGAPMAWALGLALDRSLSGASGPPEGELGLRAYGVLLIWPLLVSFAVFVVTLVRLLRVRRHHQAG